MAVNDRTLRTLTALLVGAIALIAFAVSFEAISAYAVQVGAFPSGLRWSAPLLVDTFTLAACLVILARARDGVRAVYAWSLVVVASTVSVALNVAHAPAHTSARLVAALPPAALLAALELVMSEARRLRARTASAGAGAEPHAGPALDPAGGEGPALVTALEPAPASEEPAAMVPGTAVAVGAGTSRGLVRLMVDAERDGGERATAERVMEATGVGRRRAYELLARARAEGNGHGAG